MAHTPHAHDTILVADTTYRMPELTLIGDAGEVIMGMPGGGFDGAYSMSTPLFEFELDDLDQL